MKNKKICFLLILLGWFLAVVFMMAKLHNKLTYIEFSTINSESEKYLELSLMGDEIVQEFYMPYEVLQGISVKITTFERDNNSEWTLQIIDPDSQKVICSRDFNASLMINNDYNLLKFQNNVSVIKDKKYEMHIIAKEVTENTTIAFFCSEKANIENAEMRWNQETVDGSVCFKVYGGTHDYWWQGFALGAAILILLLLARGYILSERCMPIMEDRIFLSFLAAVLVLMIAYPFSNIGAFTDENDNLRGGMIIANGGVLYRDYVTQHTPAAYYLCAVFALLGAGAVQQFRLLYYMFSALIWGGLYYRHSNFVGKRRMLLLPVLESMLLPAVCAAEGSMVLAEGIQGICMIALVLEFLRYYADRKIGWERSVIVSICIWGSIGAAFISVYALVFIVAAVIILEIEEWVKRKFTIRKGICRYYCLLISMSVPLVSTVLYFGINGGLKNAFEQAYLFNRQVYPRYQDNGLGDNLMQPFVLAAQNYFNMIVRAVEHALSATIRVDEILQVCVILGATFCLLNLFMKQKYCISCLLFALMCSLAVRGYDFHGLGAWYLALCILAIYFPKKWLGLSKAGKCIGVLLCLLLLGRYVNRAGTYLLLSQEPVSELESKVIEYTGEKEGILMDAYCCDSIYLLYKGRYPVNRLVYMLPWYMDWYEQDTIKELRENKPHFVLYNEAQNTWGYTYYANDFLENLKENYIRLSDNSEDGWQYLMWIKRD